MAMTVSAADGSLVIDLAVDTSAVLAVLLNETGSDAILERLCAAAQPAVAAPTRTEILLVALVKLGEIGLERAREFLDQQAMLTVCWDEELADASALAFQRFGRGRHPSSLNSHRSGECSMTTSSAGHSTTKSMKAWISAASALAAGRWASGQWASGVASAFMEAPAGELRLIEQEILQGIEELEGMLR